MQIVLLRHGKTRGNEEHRYVGRTDESLIIAAREQILSGRENFWRNILQREPQNLATQPNDSASKVTDGGESLTKLTDLRLWVSPLQRARETAALLCPGLRQQVVPDFREMDFGRFEYRNYAELMADPESAGIYQHFIDSGGSCGFPAGESREVFSERVCRAYQDLLPTLFGDAIGQGRTASGETPEHASKTLLIIAHGGTIMALLERFARPRRDYFDGQCACLGGFSGEVHADGTISGLSGVQL